MKIETLEIGVVIRYCIVFAPVGRYVRCGDIAYFSLFGIKIYKRAGTAWSLFGFIKK